MLVGLVLSQALSTIAAQAARAATPDPCVFACPSPGLVPSNRTEHVPSANGCSIGNNVIRMQDIDFTECCNEHDICYDTCGNRKAMCDTAFLACMMRHCEGTSSNRQAQTSCKGTANMFYAGVQMMGCSFYLDAQQQACLCVPSSTSVGRTGDSHSSEPQKHSKPKPHHPSGSRKDEL